MSGVGFWELVLVFLIGLIVLGPERLPRVASQLGSWLGQARRMTRMMRRQLEDELNLEKDFTIRRPKPRLAPPATVSREAELDDTYSPAHGADDTDEGVGSANDEQAVDTVAAHDNTAAGQGDVAAVDTEAGDLQQKTDNPRPSEKTT